MTAANCQPLTVQSPIANLQTSASPRSRLGSLLPAPCSMLLWSYFRSGWAFFISYLAVYLLYAWLKWPINPTLVGAGGVEQGARGWVPCLLHVYWAMHAIHIALAAIALRAWWKESILNLKPSTSTGARGALPSSTAHLSLDTLYRLLPWLCLALIFWIPGIYLEWPADSWEHLQRIAVWSTREQVLHHPEFNKSAYFLIYGIAYSGLAEPLILLRCYHTAICLLLGWQYYRLARTLTWETHWAFGFVLINVILFGNSTFSFYRYYSLSSSITAQIFAIALIRLALMRARSHETILERIRNGPSSPTSAMRDGFIALALLTLIYWHHRQGLAIAALGVASVCAWSIITRLDRKWLMVVLGGGFLLNMAVFAWWPRHPLVAEEYVTKGWLTAWHTYNFSPWSASGIKSWQILGLLGVADLFCAGMLLRKSRASSWLTLGTPFWLCMPIFTLPIANSIAQHGPSAVLALHRLFFAIPGGLSMVAVLRECMRNDTRQRLLVLSCALAALAALMIPPPDRKGYNRTWNLLSVPPDDLSLQEIRSPLSTVLRDASASERILAAAPITFAQCNGAGSPDSFNQRIDWTPRASRHQSLLALLRNYSVSVAAQDNPPALDSTDWKTIEGMPPEPASVDWFGAGRTTMLENRLGQRCDLLSNTQFPLEPGRTYTAEAIIRRKGSLAIGACYLSVAWYDLSDTWLDSASPSPNGASAPTGWDNGAYSYFGLHGTAPPEKWTIYRKSFGADTDTAIPTNASAFRLLARLNYDQRPTAQFQIVSFRVWERKQNDQTLDGIFPLDERLRVRLPEPLLVHTAHSVAAIASNHWLAQQVALDLSGTQEITDAAHHARVPSEVIPAQTRFKANSATQP
jgi:hypothetical protein